jgi:RimK family alpha-L-glutamate ligase
MRIAILGNQRCWHAGKLAAALEKVDVEAICVPAPQMVASVGRRPFVTSCRKTYAGVSLENVDAVVVRSIPGGSLEQVIFRVDVLHRLEDAGVRMINRPSCIEKTIDKYYTSFLFEDHGITTPRTVVTEDFDEAMLAYESMGDIVAKPLFGSLGLGIVRISDADTAYRVFSAWRTCQYVYYLQQFIPHGNSDLRALVVGDRVIAAMRRVGIGWKTNINCGAIAERVCLTAAQEELCLRIAAIFHADYIGVDLLTDDDGRDYAIEANSAPGWRGLQEVTDFDLAAELADHFIRCSKGSAMAGMLE